MKNMKFVTKNVFIGIAVGYALVGLVCFLFKLSILWVGIYGVLTVAVINFTKKRDIKYINYIACLKVDLTKKGHLFIFSILGVDSSNQSDGLKSIYQQTNYILDLDKLSDLSIEHGFYADLTERGIALLQVINNNGDLDYVQSGNYDELLEETKKLSRLFFDEIENNKAYLINYNVNQPVPEVSIQKPRRSLLRILLWR